MHVLGQIVDSSRRPGWRRPSGASARQSSTNGAPSASSTGPSANVSMRIFGPCRSARMPTSRPAASRGLAHRVGAGAMIVRLAVRKVQANHVDAFGDDLLEHARRIGGGAEGGDDLGAAEGGIGHVAEASRCRRRCHDANVCNGSLDVQMRRPTRPADHDGTGQVRGRSSGGPAAADLSAAARESMLRIGLMVEGTSWQGSRDGSCCSPRRSA